MYCRGPPLPDRVQGSPRVSTCQTLLEQVDMCRDVHVYKFQHTSICGPVSPLRHLDCPSWSSVLSRPCLSSGGQAAEKPWSRRQPWVGIITDADTANAWRVLRASACTPCEPHHSPSEVTLPLAVPSAAVEPVLQKTLLLLNRSPLGGPDQD